MTPTFTSQASSSVKFRLPLSRHHLLSVCSLIYFIASSLLDLILFIVSLLILVTPLSLRPNSVTLYIQHTKSTTTSLILKLSFQHVLPRGRKILSLPLPLLPTQR
ncbi:c5214843-7f32-4191-b5a9-6f2bedff6d84 [Sclerotinia trifoliorum]|uniref:C5214843-7f32-4191-b5a9-6f2bedff6d84 n=1 Tax=Sclerotinia trifoliorum TaxID=28548 RepID=A0A8H2ZKW2_9HELO|nr:c5214843-7f32-4191-b5a9-6f2bedff6d84 [Sclerotinia trifoliorum]